MVSGPDAEQEEEMAGFLQFCPICERQIVTPGARTLFCSETCRRMDTSNPAAVDALHGPPTVPSNSYLGTHPPDIVPPRSPTMPRPLSLAFPDLSIDDPAAAENDESGERRDAGGVSSLPHLPSPCIVSPTSVAAPRPLPSRRNKSYSAYSAPSIDLVTPRRYVGT
ncbi:hypothetical protein LTR91_007802 [Friedmanniomyces endolithicus]|uniref:Uncharacterized protein n=1 Tax=Friedmanniomyces endolithicus TaxID=329885 RepID=A0AAN6QUR5_9PEZI|nr:hypothetical protein LTR35_008658 [Friedmanniomyces endolithicus]KAK0287935.1 hypothetical protein LTS00_009780 [Friedmanniomyces endolithicus]KAK0320848.1 hypothetical protein LTR82_008166 [Friedmanniomyces endolithicus]KAK0828102.1 hypothetical protein LTR73_005055 [Friedmanniomyces endolithicus]KAK0903683.1 hypothetical protein LTR57_019047 [Friedmanniomyces endolithicus]